MIRFLVQNESEKKIPLETGMILHVISFDGYDRFVFSCGRIEEDMHAVIHSFGDDLHQVMHEIAFMTEWITKRFHPERIIIDTPDPALKNVLQSNRYYQRNHDYMRVEEDYRERLDDSVFDEEGYIINQGKMKAIPFGWFDTMQKGCGWIAAYNLLKMNGIAVTMEECAKELTNRAFLGAVMGQEAIVLQFWLKKKGLKTRLSLPGNRRAAKVMHEKPNGILLYAHTSGAHYAAFERVGDQVHFFNAVYGKRNHLCDPEEFIRNATILHSTSVLYTE